MSYAALRRLQLLVSATVAALVVWAGGLGWAAVAAVAAAGLLAGYALGRLRWRRTRARIDRRNVLIVYFNESWVYLLLVLLWAFKSFPLAAGWLVFRAQSYATGVMAMITFVACALMGHDAAHLWGARRHERERGPIRTRYFQSRSVTGQQGMIGMTGRTTRPCAPRGKAELRGEIWDAVSLDGAEIPAGAEIVVRDIEEMTVVVEARRSRPASGAPPLRGSNG